MACKKNEIAAVRKSLNPVLFLPAAAVKASPGVEPLARRQKSDNQSKVRIKRFDLMEIINRVQVKM